ncbi:MAG TPA: methyltransferase domain-containing protein [Planctomycetota bacterium]|nr:methyltransferase domain-containing protein [Planctomycetota bacterium]
MRGNRKYHDRIAGKYDQVYDSPYWRFYRDLSWRHLKPFLPSQRPARGADLGCGTGWFGVRLLRAGLQTTFLDPSGKMLEEARKAAEAEAARGLPCVFVQAGLERMAEIADGSLDFATGQGDPLSFCDDPEQALRELHRVLAPGAFLVLSVDNRSAGVRALLDEGDAAGALELLRTGRTEWRAERKAERFGMKMFDADELASLFDKTGFTVESRIGKTCLVQRRHEELLADGEARKQWLLAEERVHHKAHWLAAASHMQFAVRRR